MAKAILATKNYLYPTPEAIEKRRLSKKAYYERTRQETILRALKWAKDHPDVMAARAMKRLELKRIATPKWADLDAIDSVYRDAKRMAQETGLKFHVDHIVPIKSDIVCGLHVHWNLCILSASDNIAKGNRSWPDMP